MTCLLTTGDDRVLRDPSPETIAAHIAGLSGGDDSFLILADEHDDLTYIQAIGSAAEGFTLEYQDARSRSTSSARSTPFRRSTSCWPCRPTDGAEDRAHLAAHDTVARRTMPLAGRSHRCLIR